jgi:hypothetical protein
MGLRAHLHGQLVAPVVPDEAFTQPRSPLSHVDKAFGRNLRRLGQIEATYDSGNLFRINNNIIPAI